ncbi:MULTISPECIES: hypothetical protein [unclassified Spirosoma]|uniref:hypothetical protein n=1 Tax=unclassified Spirosoma TaxID=2621999 RepID=UPI00095B48C5|nr:MULTISPECIES: hypothetical protein [unclassified Spirosoma]MBN8824557.1 hypothetical protein [Spirosoma sp.]OJW70921.1 MAG: hypothetical protein BGO59_32370 [Spirosoma sp. 48-14]
MITENGQHGKTEAFYLIEVCCQRVSEAFGKPDRENWTNSDYINLSQVLFRKTRVRISPNTLKRIFGKIKTDARYYPQKATRDALAIYLGHPDWEHFVQIQEWAERQIEPKPVVNEPNQLPDLPKQAIISRRPPAAQKWLWLVLVAIALLAVVIFLIQPVTEPLGTVSFICRNPLGENPHSAVFELRRQKSDKDELFTILYGDGKRETTNAIDSVYTHYYERPGRYFAVLQHDGVNVDSATVYVQTKGWTATANMMHDTSRVYPINLNDLLVTKRLSVSAQDAAHAGIDTNRTFFVEFINSQPTDIDGDNFELTTRVTTSQDRAGVRCSQVGLIVWGESSQHLFDVIKPGCVHWAALQTSDVQKNGHRDDLSFLGADLRLGGTLKLKVADRKAQIFINARKVYETVYTKPMHQIYGIKIRFSGIGMVQSFLLKDLRTNKLFNGNFGGLMSHFPSEKEKTSNRIE